MTAAVLEFFMTESERRTLADLGQRTWIYRIELSPSATSVTEFRDPASEVRWPDVAIRVASETALAGQQPHRDRVPAG